MPDEQTLDAMRATATPLDYTPNPGIHEELEQLREQMRALRPLRMKFRCVTYSPAYGESNDCIDVVLAPTDLDDPERTNWASWRQPPDAVVRLTALTEATARRFELGRDYYLDFTPAPAA